MAGKSFATQRRPSMREPGAARQRASMPSAGTNSNSSFAKTNGPSRDHAATPRHCEDSINRHPKMASGRPPPHQIRFRTQNPSQLIQPDFLNSGHGNHWDVMKSEVVQKQFQLFPQCSTLVFISEIMIV